MVTAAPEERRPLKKLPLVAGGGHMLGEVGGGGDGPSVLRGALGEAALRRRLQVLMRGEGTQEGEARPQQWLMVEAATGRRQQQPAEASAEEALAALQAQRRELEAKTATLRRAMVGEEDRDARLPLPSPLPVSVRPPPPPQQQRAAPLPSPSQALLEDEAAARWVEQKRVATAARPRLMLAWGLRRWRRRRLERAAEKEAARQREAARLGALQRRALVRMQARAKVQRTLACRLCLVSCWVDVGVGSVFLSEPHHVFIYDPRPFVPSS